MIIKKYIHLVRLNNGTKNLIIFSPLFFPGKKYSGGDFGIQQLYIIYK